MSVRDTPPAVSQPSTAAAAIEVGAEGAEALAPEIEELGARVAPKAEELGSKAAAKVEHLFGKQAATETAEAGTGAAAAAAAKKPAGRQTMDRLMDVGTGVLIGQSLQGSDAGSKAAQGATQALAAAQRPCPSAPPAAPAEGAGGAAERPRDPGGRFVSRAAAARRGHLRGGAEGLDFSREGVEAATPQDFAAASTQGGASSFSSPPPTGGAGGAQGATVVVHKHPRPLAESFQIAILIVLVIIVIAVAITVWVVKPAPIASFGYGMILGAASGATVYWVLSSRAGRPKSA